MTMTHSVRYGTYTLHLEEYEERGEIVRMESSSLRCVGYKSAVMIERVDVVADWQSVCRDWRVPVA